MSDLIDRQAAIAEFSCCQLTPDGGIDANYAIDFLKQLPSAQPERRFDEWCTDCKEYDQEKHCCPRWNRVIRTTLQDAQRTGRWIRHPEQKNIYGGKCVECSECGEKYVVQYIEYEKFCRNCGARMEVEE